MEIKDIERRISKLSKNEAVILGAFCVDRMLPYYVRFEDEISTEDDAFFVKFKGGYTKLSQLLKIAIQSLNDSHNNDYSEYIEQCLELAPDTEEISSVPAVLAQNCAIGLSYIFQYLDNGNTMNINYCFQKLMECYDVVYERKDDIEKYYSELDSDFSTLFNTFC